MDEYCSAESGSEWSLSHHSWVRASKSKCLSIGPDRANVPRSNLDQVILSDVPG
jgi:hypothetical protein